MYGKVTRYFEDKGYGFIQGQDGHSYFIHASNLNGEHIEAGYFTYFETFSNKKGKYNAENVIVVETPENRKSRNRKGRGCSRDGCIRKGGRNGSKG